RGSPTPRAHRCSTDGSIARARRRESRLPKARRRGSSSGAGGRRVRSLRWIRVPKSCRAARRSPPSTGQPPRADARRRGMKQAIVHVALVVRDYDEAVDFYCRKLHFTLVADEYQPEQDKRWVVVAPPGSAGGTTLLLAKASKPEQEAFVGRQTGGRVFL